MKQDVAIVFERGERKREKAQPSSWGFKGRGEVAIYSREVRKKERRIEGRKERKK